MKRETERETETEREREREKGEIYNTRKGLRISEEKVDRWADTGQIVRLADKKINE